MERKSPLMRQRLIGWRKEPTILRIERPTDPARARRIGYKAKQGFCVARVKVVRGKRKRPAPALGRVPKKMGRFFTLDKSKRVVAEEKVSRKFPNMEVLNSYQVGEDGVHKWFEVIMFDPQNPSVSEGRETANLALSNTGGRAHRGLTAAGKRSRGLMKKGKGTEKNRGKR